MSNTFKFVVLQNPADGSQKDLRTSIRSHVTRLQHRRTRQRIASEDKSARAKRAGTEADGKTGHLPTAVRIARSGDATACAPNRYPADEEVENERDNRRRTERRAAALDDAEMTQIVTFGRINHEAFKHTGSAMAHALSTGTMSFRSITLDDPTNTIGKNLYGLQLDLSSIMSCYATICEIQGRDFEQQYGALSIQGAGHMFFALVFTDPCLLTVAILLVVRYQLLIAGRQVQGRVLMHMLNLEGHLVNKVNRALQDPGRAISDPMMAAVALCAAYDVKHGNIDAYSFHMSGLVQMIGMRGGLAAFGETNPYLKRMLVWHDINTAATFGFEPYLQKLEDQEARRPQANPRMFRTPIEAQSDLDKASKMN